jgi:hypothetical protein
VSNVEEIHRTQDVGGGIGYWVGYRITDTDLGSKMVDHLRLISSHDVGDLRGVDDINDVQCHVARNAVAVAGGQVVQHRDVVTVGEEAVNEV